MKVLFDGYWNWFFADEEPDYQITGKYLFFSSDKEKLIEIAKNEIENHSFHKAKVNEELVDGQFEHVLCLYYSDDSRKHELAERNRDDYKEKYRYWKNDEATLRGEYSEEFLNNLNKQDRGRFIADKTRSRGRAR